MSGRLLRGRVAHNRLGRPGFAYPARHLCLPLGQLDAVARSLRLLSVNRFNAFAVHHQDHGAADPTVPLATWIAARKHERGLDAADGETWLLALPRLCGHVFNPVSFWLCCDRDGHLRAVLCEVRNTFGERHCYWVHHPDLRPLGVGDEVTCPKAFHVSPFLPVQGEYRMRFRWPGAGVTGTLGIWIRWRDGAAGLNTSLVGDLRPLRDRDLAGWLVTAPASTLLVPLRIHWQALWLWLRRTRSHRKPSPPERLVSPPSTKDVAR